MRIWLYHHPEIRNFANKKLKKGVAMNASEMGSSDWWLVVLSMPMEEALYELHRYKSLLLEASIGNSVYKESAKKLTRVNDEIKIRNRRLNDCQWREVCKKILSPELFDEVHVQVCIIQDGLKVVA